MKSMMRKITFICLVSSITRHVRNTAFIPSTSPQKKEPCGSGSCLRSVLVKCVFWPDLACSLYPEFFKKLLLCQNSVVKLMGNFVLGIFVSIYQTWKSKINLTPCVPHCGHWVRNLGGFNGLSTPN